MTADSARNGSQTTGSGQASELEWSRPTAFRSREIKYIVYLIIGLYILLAIWQMRITPERLAIGIREGLDLVQAMFPPSSERIDAVVTNTVDTVQMAIVATVVGVLISIPIAPMAAQNIAPRPIYAIGRVILGVTRAFHELIVAIIFVKFFGFGLFAGIAALVFKSVGFMGKLLAEDIEDIDTGQVEAIKATGANQFKTWVYAIIPQIKPRFIGLSIYRWDINIRHSTVVGIVGAGGIGKTLINSVTNFNYDLTATILLIIIAIVMVGEYVSTRIRTRIVE